MHNDYKPLPTVIHLQYVTSHVYVRKNYHVTESHQPFSAFSIFVFQELTTEEEQYSPTRVQTETPLEEAVDCLSYMANLFDRLEGDELSVVRLCLRRNAVLAPLYKNDRMTAKVHFLSVS